MSAPVHDAEDRGCPRAAASAQPAASSGAAQPLRPCQSSLAEHFLNDSIPLLLEGRALAKSFRWRMVTDFVMHGNDPMPLSPQN